MNFNTNLFEELNVNEEDYHKLVDVIKGQGTYDEMVQKIKSLDIENKEIHTLITSWKMLIPAIAEGMFNLLDKKKSERFQVYKAKELVKESLMHVITFLQVIEKDDSTVKFATVLIPVLILGITTLVPISFCINVLKDLIKLHGFTYQDIIKGTGVVLTFIDPEIIGRGFDNLH